jgi:hypothetical protein
MKTLHDYLLAVVIIKKGKPFKNGGGIKLRPFDGIGGLHVFSVKLESF